MANVLYFTHADSWAMTLLLFIASFALIKMGKVKGQKITRMILRLFFVVMVISGLGMLFLYQFPLMYIVKGIIAVWLIAVMERILSRTEAGQRAGSSWVQFAVALLLVLLLGFEVIRF